MVKMVLDAWNARVAEAEKSLSQISDEQLMMEVAPGRSRGIYLLGHLAAVHDRLVTLLGIGEPLHPHLAEPFLSRPDRAVAEIPTPAQMRTHWHEIHANLGKLFSTLTPEEWFVRHTSVSEEDFVKEPHRNRLNAVLSRTNHFAYHVGQLNFLKGRQS